MPYSSNFPVNLDIKPSTDASLTADPGDHEFGVAAQQDAIQKFGIAGRVWEAAYLLNVYIQSPPDLLFDPPFIANNSSQPLTILELGSGTGIVSATCAGRIVGHDHTLVVTDLPEVCPLLEKNLTRHSSARPTAPRLLVRPLTWGNDAEVRSIAAELGCMLPTRDAAASPRYLTHVICSDLVYFPELLAPLLRSLIHVTSPPFSSAASLDRLPRVIISYKVRSLAKETPFWSAFGLWFSFQPVLVKSLQQDAVTDPAAANEHENETNVQNNGQTWTRFGSADDGDLFVFVASRRPESLTWSVPRSDEELLGGVGAWGTPARKSNDTFEGLLLMAMDASM